MTSDKDKLLPDNPPKSGTTEYYVWLRQRTKLARVVEKRFKILEGDLDRVNEVMKPFIDRAEEARDGIRNRIRAEWRSRKKEPTDRPTPPENDGGTPDKPKRGRGRPRKEKND